MTSVSREKIALVVFVLLVIFGIGLLLAYLNIGHNWNVTASQIDDATGELEGYTVILYAGTVEEPAEEESSVASSADDGKDVADKARSEVGESDESNSDDVDDGSSRAHVKDASAVGDGDPSGSDSASSEPDLGSESGSETGLSASGSRVSGGAAPLFASSSSSARAKDPVSVEDVAASYREKDAQVLVIDVDNLGAYAEGLILKRGDRRIGVFSVAFNEPIPRVQAKVDGLRAADVDFVVAVTPDRQFVESASGIDIALSLEDEGSSFLGGTVDGTFYVDSPLVGQVGAVLVSPHNVVSAKDVTEL